MIKGTIKSNNGITLISLIFAIILMIVISSTVIYNAHTGLTTRALNNMYNDIKTLKDRVDIYYSKYSKLPIIENPQYTNVDNFKSINKNDNNNYFVIDLESLDNLTLTYGKEFATYKQSQIAPKGDIYVINEKSHTIYYVAGIVLDNKTYYTIPEEYTEIKFSTKCNPPKLGEGMTPIKWNETEFIDTTSYDSQWYNYIDTSIDGQTSLSKWANARTEDGSMWVWIPRYAYKIKYNNEEDKSLGGMIDIVFLKDNTNYDYRGFDVTNANYIDESGTIGAYTIHPSFQDGRGNGFANGEWDEEITGFWMAKFEAGYEGTANDPSSAKDSVVEYSVIYGYNKSIGNLAEITNTYYGTRAIGDNIKYPVFMANKPSMNYIGISDSYNLCKNLTAENNPYGLNNINSHLTKNSEWGAVAYLAHSKYGRNGEEIRINNVSANGENTIFAVTGYGASVENAPEDTTRRLNILTLESTEKGAGDWIDNRNTE